MKQGDSALSPSPRARSDLAAKQLRDDGSLSITSETVGFCCLFFCYLSVIPLLFVFLYHAFPTTILLIIFLLGLSSFIPCAFHRGKHVIAEPAGPILSATMLACTAVAFFGSMYMYWAHVQPMRALLLAREYRNVYPELPSVAFGDAAFVQFAGNTSVDVTKAVAMGSLDAGMHTFCLAPITNGASRRIEFWAVGMDCCGSGAAGKFECDDAGKVGAKNGYVMQNPTDALFDLVGKYIAPPILRRDIFLQAIAKAEHTQQLTTGKEPLLVRWTKMTKEEMIEQEVIHVVFQCSFNLVLALGMSLLLTKLVHRFVYLRKIQKVSKHGAGAADKELNVSARMGEFKGFVEEDGELLHGEFSRVSGLEAEAMGLAIPRSDGPRPKLKLKDTFVTGIIVPYTIMMLSVLLTTYSPCHRFGHLLYAPFLTMNGIGILALLATPGRVLNGFFILLVSIVGLYIGSENYTANMYNYCKVEDRRTYSNVPSETKSDTYWDAGTLKFEERSYLSQEHAVGFLYHDVTYCVAPILSYESDCTTAPISLAAGIATPESFLQRTSRMHAGSKRVSLVTDLAADADDGAPVQCKKVAPKRIDYWAIGTDCCSARKDFRCDGGKDKNAHSGVVVLATGAEEPGDDRDQFSNAIKQSAASYGLPLPSSPVLIRWGSDAKALQRDWKTRATGVIILTAMIGLMTIMVISLGGFFYMQRARSSQQKEAGAEHAQSEDEQARRQEFGPPQSRTQLRV